MENIAFLLSLLFLIGTFILCFKGQRFLRFFLALMLVTASGYLGMRYGFALNLHPLLQFGVFVLCQIGIPGCASIAAKFLPEPARPAFMNSSFGNMLLSVFGSLLFGLGIYFLVFRSIPIMLLCGVLTWALSLLYRSVYARKQIVFKTYDDLKNPDYSRSAPDLQNAEEAVYTIGRRKGKINA